ncbi:MAG TPA: aldo/keto reductase [Syntrophorhabdales bacterium]|nr:aldo/keto reductase [Syntrophorhabdales bacterium]
MNLPKRLLGRTGVQVSILGLGGEGILRTLGRDKEAHELINAAIDLGVTYFESARAYSGSESYYGDALRERREDIFLSSKSHARDKEGAAAHLAQTLKAMKTKYLDLWQIHDVRTEDEMEEIFGPDGALEAFVEAKKKGDVRFIGVTGHDNPAVLRRCLQKFNFDTVLLPVNPAEPQYESFLTEVIPVAVAKRMGILGMKVYFRGLAQRLPWYSGMERFFRFALTQPITAAVIGCDNLMQLSDNADMARRFEPMSDREATELIDATAPFARQLMYYKP